MTMGSSEPNAPSIPSLSAPGLPPVGRRVHGRITEVWDLEGYGYVAPEGGGSLYFDRAGVARGHFARLLVGSEVSFERAGAADSEARAERLRVVRDPDSSFRRS